MNKVLITYIIIYAISISITLYGFFFNKDLILPSVKFSAYITPPFIVYLCMKKNKNKNENK